MAITRDEVNFATEQYQNVRDAYYDAVNAYRDLLAAKKRYDAKPGFFTKLKRDNRLFVASNFAARFLETYSARTGQVVDASETSADTALVIDMINWASMTSEERYGKIFAGTPGISQEILRDQAKKQAHLETTTARLATTLIELSNEKRTKENP